ncbi:MAG: hypothetical protein V1790_11995 [Planctomycetota bacterium]
MQDATTVERIRQKFRALRPMMDEATLFVLAADVPTSPADASKDNFKKNTLSIVLRITLGDVNVVLTADATFDTEDVIRSRYTQANSMALVSEVLKLGHHGSRVTSTSAEWAEAVHPRTAIANASATKYGHPAKEVLERISLHTADDDPPHTVKWGVSLGENHFRYDTLSGVQESIYTTASNGTVVVETDGHAYCVVREK